MQIPANGCSKPDHCDPGVIVFPCNNISGSSTMLFDVGVEHYYFPLDIVSPFQNHDLTGCMNTCLKNFSCIALFFFENNSGDCLLFNQMGSLQMRRRHTGLLLYYKAQKDIGTFGNINQYLRGIMTFLEKISWKCMYWGGVYLLCPFVLVTNTSKHPLTISPRNLVRVGTAQFTRACLLMGNKLL